MLEKLMTELIQQAPAIAAVIIIVAYFIKAMQEQRAVFNAMMTERDRLFDEALRRRDEIFQRTMEVLSQSINSVENTMIELDSDARHNMGMKRRNRSRGNKKAPS